MENDIFSADALYKIFLESISLGKALGRDGIRPDAYRHFAEHDLQIASHKIAKGTFQFTPYREALILRGANKYPRQIFIPTVRDRTILRATLELIRSKFPQSEIPNPNKIIILILDQLASIPPDQIDYYCFVRMDIKDFYPSIVHDLLFRKIRARIRLLARLSLVQGAIERGQTRPGHGIPQGLSISNALSQIYLEHLDKKSVYGCTIYRYVDDILIISPAHLAQRVYTTASKRFSKLGLSVHGISDGSKSSITTLREGTEFLGYQVKIGRISVRKNSFERMFTNIKRICTQYKHDQKYEKFVWRLNLKITGCIYRGTRYGWMFYFSKINDVSQLALLDKFVSDEIQKIKIDSSRTRICRFQRVYFEICYRLHTSKYIPNFDKISLEEKVNDLVSVFGLKKRELLELSAEQIDELFQKSIKREVSVLQRDIGHVS